MKTFDIDKFNHRPETVELVKSLEDQLVGKEEFVTKYKSLKGSKRTPCKAKKLYDYLMSVGWIK